MRLFLYPLEMFLKNQTFTSARNLGNFCREFLANYLYCVIHKFGSPGGGREVLHVVDQL